MIPELLTEAELAQLLTEAREQLEKAFERSPTDAVKASLLDQTDDLLDAIKGVTGGLRVKLRMAAGGLCLCGSGQPFETCGPKHAYPVMVDPSNPRNRGGVKL